MVTQSDIAIKLGTMTNRETLLAYLHSMEDGVALQLNYKGITERAGMYGNRPAIHNFYGTFEWKGEQYEYWGQHTYTYPNFVKQHGEMESCSTLQVKGKEPIEFYFKEKNWKTIFEKLQCK